MGARKSKGGSNKNCYVPAVKPEPWERQEKEPGPSFERFIVYRDMEKRNIGRIAEIYGLGHNTLNKLASQWNWTGRAAAWDAELDRRLREAEIDELKKMQARQISIAVGMQQAGAAELQALTKKIQHVEALARQNGWPAREPVLSPKDTVRMIDMGSKLERLNRGESTENVALSGEQTQGMLAPPQITIKLVKPDGSGNS